MKKFIYKLLCNSFIFLVLVIFSFITLGKCINYLSEIKVNSEYQSVIMGHSHAECAYNDVLISGTHNFSDQAESYFYTLQKLRFIIDKSDNINNVFIEFSNNQINVKMNDWTYGDAYINNKAPNFMHYMDLEDHMVLVTNNFTGYFNSVSIFFQNSFMRILRQNFNYSKNLGGYLKLNKNIIDNPPLESDEIKHSVSVLNIKYLKKIVILCKENNVNLTLIRTPQHPQYEYLVNEKEFQKIRAIEFVNIRFIDLNDFILEWSDFADFGHLNEQGAIKVSKYFNTLINE